ncbi:MAG: DUF3142 domain-containing protein [Syntrophobacteraceae bacterium]
MAGGQTRLLILIQLVLILALSIESVAAASPACPVETKGAAGPDGRMDSFPRLVLWAWEKPERLGFIDVKLVGVAFLSRTCILEGDRVAVRPRMQPLRTPPGTALMAVVRIESSRLSPPRLGTGQMDELIRMILQAVDVPGLRGIQIDFDARTSQRRFYRELLVNLRAALPDSMPLSITALASWCIYDDWISDLPVDEIVPMVFRMGADAGRVRSHLAPGAGFACRKCRGSVGVCTDEPWPVLSGQMRVYVFQPGAWTRKAYEKAETNIEKLKMTVD